jgi:hypothetical protein
VTWRISLRTRSRSMLWHGWRWPLAGEVATCACEERLALMDFVGVADVLRE